MDGGEGAWVYCECYLIRNHSEAVAPDPLGQLEVLAHDGHSLGMDGAEVGVLEERHQVGLCCLLERQHSLTLEANFLFELGGDLADQSLEGQLADEQVGLNKHQTARKGPPEGGRIKGHLHSSGIFGSLWGQRFRVWSGGVFWHRRRWGRTCGRSSGRRAACGAPFGRWTCGQSAWFGPSPIKNMNKLHRNHGVKLIQASHGSSIPTETYWFFLRTYYITIDYYFVTFGWGMLGKGWFGHSLGLSSAERWFYYIGGMACVDINN